MIHLQFSLGEILAFVVVEKYYQMKSLESITEKC